MKACVCVSQLLGVTIKEITVLTVPQVLLSLIQLVMGGVQMCVCVCVYALYALHAPLSKEQTDGSCFGQSCLSLASDLSVQPYRRPDYSERAANMPETKG